jgi:hypothetical protein
MSEKKINSTQVDALPLKTKDGASFTIMQRKPNTFTHGFFKYPCKFIPEIPRWSISKYMNNESGLVFDPFSGSGTTLLEAKILGFDSIGTEIDPVAKKIITVKTENYTKEDLFDIDKNYQEIVRLLLKENKKIVAFRPSINNLEHWFTEENLEILGKLKSLIDDIKNKKSKSFLELVFLSIIKAVSQADDSSPKPYVSKKIVKTAPNALEKFKSTFEKYREKLEEYTKLNLSNAVKIADGDALYTTDNFKADIAITSPPYINAFDYPRTLRLENLWMETHTEGTILDSKSKYVGTEKFKISQEKEKSFEILEESSILKDKFYKIKEIDEKRALVVKKFFDDMKQNLYNVQKHLKKGAVYVIVIGNSTIRKESIESWKILKDIAENMGYDYVEHISYNILNPYIRIPRSGRGGKISQDHILVLKNK